MAEAIVGAIAPNIFDRCVGAAGEHLGYIWNYKKNIANLQTQVEKLDKERDDKSHSVTVAVRNAHKIKNSVKGWQDQTDKISEEAAQIINDYEEKGKKRCLLGLCPNVVSRYQFSKKACAKATEIVDAIREAGEIREVSDRVVGMGREIVLSTEGCFTFDSRKSILEDIVRTLQDETKNSVGVYGLGGMGKTTLAKQVASHVQENMFEEVAMASVTKKVDIKEIQGQIASMLDLKLEESSVAERASRIHERLKGKKVLVVLDDLWAELDLLQVGIPFGAEHMGCKVLLTSRSFRVLSLMGTREEYVLGALEEDEAWRLFEERVIHIVKDPKYLTVGKKLVKRCAGLPILIVTVAAALAKRKHLDAWNDALTQIEKMNSRNMHDIVNSAIESISYECLEDTHKQLFLLCGLMQGRVYKEDLLRFILGWDIFGEGVVTVEGARNRMHALIFDLKEFCLLLDGEASDFIIMHDVVRDVALSIARKDLNAFSVGPYDTDISRWPKNDVLTKCTAMVFYSCPELPCLPQRLECPSLELFILTGDSVDSKPTIPDTFFERSSKLKVLDMSSLSFPTLPLTLSSLKNLQSLHLDYCQLQDISIVGELKKLQVLSLICSAIEELPSSLGQLSELKLLDLDGCFQLKVIPSGLIASLSQLEELNMRGYFYGWQSEECFSNSGRCNASFAELKCLRNLTSLRVRLQDAKLLAEDLNFENWKRYEIIVAEDMYRRSSQGCFRVPGIKTSIALQLGTNSFNHLQHVVNTLFKRTEGLCLEELKGINNVIPELNEDGFPELKHLRIVKDSEIQYIVNVEDKQHKASFRTFPVLESLHLISLHKVEKLYNARLMKGSFLNLTIVEVQHCNSLESLFTPSIAMGLEKIQTLAVENCPMMKAIVGNEGGETIIDKITFPQLIHLSLIDLPNLTRFCSPAEQMNSNKKLDSGVQPLFNEKIQFPKLEKLNVDRLDSISTIWQSQQLYEVKSFCKLEEVTVTNCASLLKIFPSTVLTTTKINLEDDSRKNLIFQNLSAVTVRICKSLKYVFPASMAGPLNQLKTVRVEDCGVKTVMGDDEDEILNEIREVGDQVTTTFTFSNLVTINLCILPELECFYPREHIIDWPTLEQLNVFDCDKFSVLDFLDFTGRQGNDQRNDQIIKVISSLQSLRLNGADMMKLLRLCDVFSPQLSLAELTITQFHGELPIFPSKFLNIIHHQLQTFEVRNCSCQEIFPYEGGVADLVNDDVVFPRLRNLILVKLSEMECICKQDQYSAFIPNIEYLRVKQCPRLTNLVPPSVSFKLLKEMRILNCGGLINLLQPSTATSLEQLEFLYISGCDMIEEIIGGDVRDDDEESSSSSSCRKDEIIFSKLWYLNLGKLSSLTSFCSSRKYTFNFPKLNTVFAIKCPNMKTFCGGITTTPQLNKIYLTDFRSEERWEGELNTTFEKIYEQREVEKLATTLPSVTATNHSEAQAQEERAVVTYTCKKSKGKEVEVSQQGVEQFKKSETSRYSDPSCSNYTASYSRLSPQISNHPREASPSLTTEVEAHTPGATVLTTSPSNQFEAQAQIHDTSHEKSIAETEKESRILRNCMDGVTTCPRKETENCEQVVKMESQGLTIKLPSTSPSGRFEREVEIHEKLIEELIEPTEQDQISKHIIDELGNEVNASEKTTKLINEYEFCDNSIEPKQVTKISPRLVTKAETENFIPLIRESFRALGAQPMSSLNAEQVQFVNDASDWLCAYAKKATKFLERNTEISDLKREIAEKESKLRALQDENEATSPTMPSFG